MQLDVKDAVSYLEIWVTHLESNNGVPSGYLGVEIFGDNPTYTEVLKFLTENKFVPLDFNSDSRKQGYFNDVFYWRDYTELIPKCNEIMKQKLIQIRYNKEENVISLENELELLADLRYNKETERRTKGLNNLVD